MDEQKPYKILLVDDEIDVLTCYKLLFELSADRFGGKFKNAIILEATSASQALEHANAHMNTLDLVVLDNNLAGARGQEHYPGIGLLGILRNGNVRTGKKYDLKMPILFCSVDADASLIKRIESYNATYLPKEFTQEKFIQITKRMLEIYETEQNGLFVLDAKDYGK